MTSKERATLKSAAHHLKPTFQIGAASVHENTLKALDTAFNNRELLKVKVNRVDKADKDEARKVADEIAKGIDVEVVAVIGTTIILYRQSKDKDLRIL